ncbi:MAG: ornithine carbamoyltransferase [Candidatus Aminicenantes bacterium]|jgi:ornithine carbamoyltransferase
MKKEKVGNYNKNERVYWLKRFSGNVETVVPSPYKKRDFISLTNYTQVELEALLEFTERIKSGKDTGQYLANKTVGLMFGVASTRTRISFQVGARQLGGHADFYNTNDLQLVYHESLIDTVRVMERYINGLVVRMYDMNHYSKGRDALNILAKYGDIPVINALDDKDHPCQAMGDIFTMKEKFGEDYKKKKVVFTWGYSWRQKSPGVPHSMMTGAALLGMNIVFVYPRGFELDEEYVSFAREAVKQSGGTLEFSNDLGEACEEADVIYVKSWKSLNMSSEEDQKFREQPQVRRRWCVSDHHFKKAKPGALFMNCLPIIRGEQATAEVIDGKHSIIYDEAENRLHIQKAIMAGLIR